MLKYMYVLSKKYFTCISHEHKPFWQLSRSDDFTVNAFADLFVYERFKISDAYSELSRTSEIELSAKIANDQKPLTIYIKKLHLRYSTGK